MPQKLKTWVADTAVLIADLSGKVDGDQEQPETEPSNSTSCASENGICECASDMVVYYGFEKDGVLDETQNYTRLQADQSGYTSCSNSVFGDPLYGTVKSCFCQVANDQDPVETIESDRCAKENEICECEEGMTIYYGAEEQGELDTTRDFKVLQADSSGFTACSNSVFGDPLFGIVKSCFCEIADNQDTIGITGSEKCAGENEICECD